MKESSSLEKTLFGFSIITVVTVTVFGLALALYKITTMWETLKPILSKYLTYSVIVLLAIIVLIGFIYLCNAVGNIALKKERRRFE